MKNKLFIYAIIFSLFISWLPVSNTQTAAATTYANLGVANDFNIFVFNDHIQMTSDAEGRVAVGNKAEYTDYSIGKSLSRSTERFDLIVGETLSAVRGNNFNGNTAIGTGGTVGTYTMTNNNGVVGNPIEVDLKKELINFEEVYNDLMYKSSKWSELTPNGIVGKNGNNITLTGDDSKLNIFELTTEDLSVLTSGSFTMEVPDSAAVLINVSGTHLRMGNFGFNLDPTDGSRILWNFPNLIELDIYSLGFVGSILAPNAALKPSGWGQINGTIILKDFINSYAGSYELHHHPFNVRLPLEDEDKGIIQFDKVDQETGDGLQGAIFGLYESEECQGNPKYRATSDINGVVKFNSIPYGTYYLKEIKAPKGYQLSTEIRKVTVNMEKVDAGTFGNVVEEKGSIQFTKVEKGNESNLLEGATFRLYLDKECTKKADHADVTSDKNGLVKFTDLPYGTYYVKEVKAPEHYKLSEEIRAVTVNEKLVNEEIYVNERIKELVGSIEFTKVDKETGKGLEGAVFALYDNEECKGEARYKATSSGNGLVRFADVRYGKYYLKEIKAPAGYQASDKILPIEVKSSHLNLGKIEDVALTGTIEFTKVDKETGKGLEGAVFGLYENEKCEGEAKYKATSSGNGLVRFADVRYGTYYLKEIKAPAGYQTSDKIVKIEVNKSLLNLGKIEDEAIKIPTGAIEVKKIDSKDKKVLEGAEFELYLDGKVIKTGKTDKNGSLNFENLSYGTYEIKETKAPKGYQLSDEVKKVEINSSKKVVIEFENTLINQSIMPESPSGSDSSNQLVDSDSDSNVISSDEVMTGSDSKQQTGEGMFLNGLPQTGDALTRTLIVLGLILVFAGIIFLTKRAKN